MGAQLLFEESAPGRLDVMGGIADYSGSLVLQMPICERTIVQLELRDDYRCTLESRLESGETFFASADYNTFLSEGKVDYAFAVDKIKQEPEKAWIAYVLGCVLVCQKEKQIDFRGANFKIRSTVPLGKGVSSSAALEVATMKVLARAFDIVFEGTELARLAQQAENLVVGAPCGLMDQLCSYMGESGKILPIICQPDQFKEQVPVPDAIHFIGIDSGVRHAVGGSTYTDVRCAAFMGYTMIARELGASRQDLLYARQRQDFSPLSYLGYLSNISAKEFETKFEMNLPVQISGREFIDKYKMSIDHVTTVDPNKNYQIRTCTGHPIYENERVHEFRELLTITNNSGVNTKTIRRMGELMYQSHNSYSQCGLDSERTDEIVRWVKELGPPLYGARVTGGGSGGTVCILALGPEGKESAHRLHLALCAKYKVKLKFFETQRQNT